MLTVLAAAQAQPLLVAGSADTDDAASARQEALRAARVALDWPDDRAARQLIERLHITHDHTTAHHLGLAWLSYALETKEGARLYGLYLVDADLSGADLRGANLSGADLRGVDLFEAHLSGADLSGANLFNTKLLGVDLKGADLRGADLRGGGPVRGEPERHGPERGGHQRRQFSRRVAGVRGCECQ